MDAVVLVAFTHVGPVGDVNAAVGAVDQLDTPEPGILAEQEVGCMDAGISGPFAFQAVLVEPLAMQVDGIQFTSITIGPVATQVDHHAAVRMSAAGGICCWTHLFLGFMPGFGGIPMNVIRIVVQ